MSFEVLTYSPLDVHFTICGYNCVGWVDMSIHRSVESFKTVRGIRDTHTRARSKDSSSLITVTLTQVSPTNDVLSDIHTLDIQRGTGRLVVQITDKSGTSLFNSHEAYIVNYPAIKFSDGFENRVWEIFCQSTKWAVGGNSKPQQSAVQNVLSSLGIK